MEIIIRTAIAKEEEKDIVLHRYESGNEKKLLKCYSGVGCTMCMKQTMGRKNMEKFKFLNQVRKIERIEWVDSMTNKVLIRLMENIMLLNIILKTKAKNKIYYDRKRNV